MTHRFVEPSNWPAPRGYANGVVATGHVVTLAGQVGWNPVTGAFESDDFVEQARQALDNIAVLLREAGAEPAHLVRLTWYITDRAAYLNGTRALGEAYRAALGRTFPPMSVVVVAGLVEPRALVEIEATAVVPEPDR